MFRLPSDRKLILTFIPFLAATVLTVLGIFLFLFIETAPALEAHRLTEYFGSVHWDPSSGQYGLLPMLLGSLLCSALALALAVPMSVLTTGYLCFFSSKWLSIVLTRLTELMAAIPSVVHGVWGLMVLVPLVGSIRTPGTSLLTGSIILAAMLTPTLILQIRVNFTYTSKRLKKVLRQVGLWNEIKGRLDDPASKLSGGQQQRLCMARALVVDPVVLLLDEPCSALDPVSTEVVEENIRSLKDRIKVIMVTHNLAQARRLADRLIVFASQKGYGEIVECGDAQKIFTNPSHEQTRSFFRFETALTD